MPKIFLIACWWMSFMLSMPAQGPASQPRPSLPETNPYSSAADVESGRRLYIGRCAHCHGQDGEGGRGAVLNTGRFRHGSSDREIFLVIRNGIPNTEMPGAFNSPGADVWRIVAYVQQLGRQGLPEPVGGDAAAGALVYQENGCALCHTINGKGGFWGPDLSDIGAKRAVRYLRESVLEPSADIPLDYRTVEVISVTGKSSKGIHLNEDEYSVHMRDVNGNLRSFMKSELNDIKLPRKSLMPAYTTLSKDELENLVGYLSSLRPKRRTQ
ncbi:MAG TPA: c-type cytochrome [Acidobacteriota bacterium]|jgi:putative heme-binding domain-containing protein|nr:c-type cytochrome [Acidobacteriota bacterium]